MLRLPRRKKRLKKTKEEELCGKLLKKTPTPKYPIFKPANLSDFQNAAGTFRRELKTNCRARYRLARVVRYLHREWPGNVRARRMRGALAFEDEPAAFETALHDAREV